jgi:hypothetical protein
MNVRFPDLNMYAKNANDATDINKREKLFKGLCKILIIPPP